MPKAAINKQGNCWWEE